MSVNSWHGDSTVQNFYRRGNIDWFNQGSRHELFGHCFFAGPTVNDGRVVRGNLLHTDNRKLAALPEHFLVVDLGTKGAELLIDCFDGFLYVHVADDVQDRVVGPIVKAVI